MMFISDHPSCWMKLEGAVAPEREGAALTTRGRWRYMDKGIGSGVERNGWVRYRSVKGEPTGFAIRADVA